MLQLWLSRRRLFCTYKVSIKLLTRLGRLSALKIDPEQDLKNLEEDIRLAQKIFEINTTNVKPLYNVSEDYITCPMRNDDDVEIPTKEEAFINTKKKFEGFFVAPSVGVVENRKNKENNKDNDF